MRIAAFTIALLFLPSICAAQTFRGMLELKLGGKQIEGMPISWNPARVHMLGRDGRLWSFKPREASDYRIVSDRFRSYSPSELRALLLRQLGSRFDVSGTTHYMIAHPKGERIQWAERFEKLYRSFVRYFSVRGFQLETPEFLLIGVVCHDQMEFIQYTAKNSGFADPNVLGYYAIKSNRITLFDAGSGRSNSNYGRMNADTIIHEATHQMAFNTGIHSRYFPAPLWVVEGLATMFEAKGVHDSHSFTQRSDRINRGRFEYFRKHVIPNSSPELLADTIASDESFRTNPAAAYACAWALTFYLVETQPRKYADYLSRTVDHRPFTKYTTLERVSDFTEVFGDDWRMLEAQLIRFAKQLRLD